MDSPSDVSCLSSESLDTSLLDDDDDDSFHDAVSCTSQQAAFCNECKDNTLKQEACYWNFDMHCDSQRESEMGDNGVFYPDLLYCKPQTKVPQFISLKEGDLVAKDVLYDTKLDNGSTVTLDSLLCSNDVTDASDDELTSCHSSAASLCLSIVESIVRKVIQKSVKSDEMEEYEEKKDSHGEQYSDVCCTYQESEDSMSFYPSVQNLEEVDSSTNIPFISSEDNIKRSAMKISKAMQVTPLLIDVFAKERPYPVVHVNGKATTSPVVVYVESPTVVVVFVEDFMKSAGKSSEISPIKDVSSLPTPSSDSLTTEKLNMFRNVSTYVPPRNTGVDDFGKVLLRMFIDYIKSPAERAAEEPCSKPDENQKANEPDIIVEETMEEIKAGAEDIPVQKAERRFLKPKVLAKQKQKPQDTTKKQPDVQKGREKENKVQKLQQQGKSVKNISEDQQSAKQDSKKKMLEDHKPQEVITTISVDQKPKQDENMNNISEDLKEKKDNTKISEDQQPKQVENTGKDQKPKLEVNEKVSKDQKPKKEQKTNRISEDQKPKQEEITTKLSQDQQIKSEVALKTKSESHIRACRSGENCCKEARAPEEHKNSNPPRRRTGVSLERAKKVAETERRREEEARVERAIQEHKVFLLECRAPSIKRALLSRGWVQKAARSMSLSVTRQPALPQGSNAAPRSRSTDSNALRDNISSMLNKANADFIWTLRNQREWSSRLGFPLVSRLPNAVFTTKIGLHNVLKKIPFYWGVRSVNFPRTFSMDDPDEQAVFINDFRITSCTSLMKWYIANYDKRGRDGVSSANGTVPINVLIFAINRSTEYMQMKKTGKAKYYEKTRKLRDTRWDKFLSSYYLIVHSNNLFMRSEELHPSQKLYGLCKGTLHDIKKFRPQLNLEGIYNIWIMKPDASCRGLGIELKNTLTGIFEKNRQGNRKYIIQKYIEQPLLIYDTKFDIRQWFLISSLQPISVWMYKECYLRFSSQRFNLKNFHESVHLCNNAVQCKYKNESRRSELLPKENMWDLQMFKEYLSSIGALEKWDTVVYPGMSKCIISAVLLSQDQIGSRPNCFELFGADFMLTRDFVPWLLEINSSPAMGPTTKVTERLCAQCLEDLVKVVLDRRKKRNADTGCFECIYMGQARYRPNSAPASDGAKSDSTLPSQLPTMQKLKQSSSSQQETSGVSSKISTSAQTSNNAREPKKVNNVVSTGKAGTSNPSNKVRATSAKQANTGTSATLAKKPPNKTVSNLNQQASDQKNGPAKKMPANKPTSSSLNDNVKTSNNKASAVQSTPTCSPQAKKGANSAVGRGKAGDQSSLTEKVAMNKRPAKVLKANENTPAKKNFNEPSSSSNHNVRKDLQVRKAAPINALPLNLEQMNEKMSKHKILPLTANKANENIAALINMADKPNVRPYLHPDLESLLKASQFQLPGGRDQTNTAAQLSQLLVNLTKSAKSNSFYDVMFGADGSQNPLLTKVSDFQNTASPQRSNTSSDMTTDSSSGSDSSDDSDTDATDSTTSSGPTTPENQDSMIQSQVARKKMYEAITKKEEPANERLKDGKTPTTTKRKRDLKGKKKLKRARKKVKQTLKKKLIANIQKPKPKLVSTPGLSPIGNWLSLLQARSETVVGGGKKPKPSQKGFTEKISKTKSKSKSLPSKTSTITEILSVTRPKTHSSSVSSGVKPPVLKIKQSQMSSAGVKKASKGTLVKKKAVHKTSAFSASPLQQRELALRIKKLLAMTKKRSCERCKRMPSVLSAAAAVPGKPLKGHALSKNSKILNTLIEMANAKDRGMKKKLILKPTIKKIASMPTDDVRMRYLRALSK